MCTFGLSGLLCETPALPKVENWPKWLAPVKLRIDRKEMDSFSFSLACFIEGFFSHVFQALTISFSLEMPMEKGGSKNNTVDFGFSPEPHVAFCPIFVHPF